MGTLALGGRGPTDIYVFMSGEQRLVHFDGASWRRTANLPAGALHIVPVGTHLFAGMSVTTTTTSIVRESTSSMVGIGDMITGATTRPGASAVWGRSCDDVFIATGSPSMTDGGALVHFDGATWTREYDQTNAGIEDVYGTSLDVYAITGNAVLRRSGTSWPTMQTFPSALRAVWAAPDVVVAGGDNQWIHRYTGTWTSTQLPGNVIYGVEGVAGFGPDDLYVVRGGPNPIVHFDGNQWTDVPLPAGAVGPFWAIWASDDGRLIVVGDKGQALHLEGGTWRLANMPYDDYKAIHGSSINDVFAVGLHGTIARFDGAHWAPVRSPGGQMRSTWTNSSCTYITAEASSLVVHRLARSMTW
jgi:hypothetical protein